VEPENYKKNILLIRDNVNISGKGLHPFLPIKTAVALAGLYIFFGAVVLYRYALQ
jgi:hypothetical protein